MHPLSLWRWIFTRLKISINEVLNGHCRQLSEWLPSAEIGAVKSISFSSISSNYKTFKKELHNLFPDLYDTKHLVVKYRKELNMTNSGLSAVSELLTESLTRAVNAYHIQSYLSKQLRPLTFKEVLLAMNDGRNFPLNDKRVSTIKQINFSLQHIWFKLPRLMVNELDAADCHGVITLRNNSLKQHEIARQYGISKVLKRQAEMGVATFKPRPGRPKKDRLLIRMCTQVCTISRNSSRTEWQNAGNCQQEAGYRAYRPQEASATEM
ncbi:hypothetical protein GQR58_013225 [Nymphon striatum]|nr:hypothetical protein GQR58_013225 [Nymphon striatum]